MNSEPLQSNKQSEISKRQANRRIDSMISYVTTVGSACLILMWSVFNIWLNVLQYRAAKTEEAEAVMKIGESGPSWMMTGLMVALTCVVPFFIGLMLLFKTIKMSNKKARAA